MRKKVRLSRSSGAADHLPTLISGRLARGGIPDLAVVAQNPCRPGKPHPEQGRRQPIPRAALAGRDARAGCSRCFAVGRRRCLGPGPRPAGQPPAQDSAGSHRKPACCSARARRATPVAWLDPPSPCRQAPTRPQGLKRRPAGHSRASSCSHRCDRDIGRGIPRSCILRETGRGGARYRQRSWRFRRRAPHQGGRGRKGGTGGADRLQARGGRCRVRCCKGHSDSWIGSSSGLLSTR